MAFKEENIAIPTSYGDILVHIYGNRAKHPLVTFHDVGLNAEDNFRNFFQFSTVPELTEEFCIYNINAPGQESEAAKLHIGYHYPTMDDLALMVDEIVTHLNLKCFIGLGYGAGAYIILKYALKHPHKLDALVLINSISNAPTWYEWGKEKINVSELKHCGITPQVVDFLMWRNFGNHIEKDNPQLVKGYRDYFEKLPNPTNLASFLESYLNRKSIEFEPNPSKELMVLQIVGERIYSLTDANHIRHKFEPTKTELINIANCSGRVLDESPDKVTEAVMLFLQGVGFFPALNVHEIVQRKASENK
jgi:pimeloyl-ACP methyl ester carboxylesterase